MKLPYFEQATVLKEKVTDYLLSPTHVDGRAKAAFFTQFGFSLEAWEVFAHALLQHAALYEVATTINSQYGIKYVIEGSIVTPDKRNPAIRSVWIIEIDDTTPKLVTAYPLR